VPKMKRFINTALKVKGTLVMEHSSYVEYVLCSSLMTPGVVFTNLSFSCQVLLSSYGVHFFDLNYFVVEVDI
jgi:hypothetical protein